MRIRLFIASCFLLVCAFVASFFVSPAKALENPHFYYDWNMYTPSGLKVLGATTFDDYKNFQTHNYAFGFISNISPTSPFYFVKKTEEGVSLAFTFNSQDREKVRLGIAGERLLEMQQMAQAGKTNEVKTLARDYQDETETLANDLDSLKKKEKDITTLSNTIDTEAAKHELVLEQVALQASLQVEKDIKTALTASQKTADTVADVLGKPAVPQQVVQRLEALKAQGILTPEEVQKIVSTDSRQTAREEMRKYVDSRIIPESDFKKLDETAATKFPQGYYASVELSKFNELKNLETQKPDDGTIKKIQDFSKTYKPGDVVPSDIRSWWAPMVRLEELQNTIRPDLINQDLLKNRPEDQQKYKELVERVKPRAEDVAYVNTMIKNNPNLLNDPSYARIKSLSDTFGTTDTTNTTQTPTPSCGNDSHWANVPFMPNGGYCVPNVTYSVSSLQTGSQQGQFATDPCPPGYHRNDPQGACYPNNPTGSGLRVSDLPAQGSCPAGYKWVTTGNTGYCNPDYTGQGGAFPSPVAPPAYCPAGQMFMDGKCQNYTPPPTTGCSAGQYWSGNTCITYQNCGAGYYQGSDGQCRANPVQSPNTGSNNSIYYDEPNASNRPQQEATCKAGGGTCTWNGDVCNCQGYHSPSSSSYSPSGSSGSYQPPSSQTPSSGSSSSPSTSCGAGYYWNGNYCAASSGSSTTQTSPQPSTQPQPSSSGNGMSRSQQESACNSGGGTCNWNGDTCNCQGYHAPSSSSPSTSNPQPTSPPTQQSQPTSPPQPQQSSPAPQPQSSPGMDPATECANHGGTWANNTCTGAH